ncbi:MAG: PilZ domain-containing protein [Spirochaetales bacterium]|nr:PilZ domain-containing protein [Spirochaetales bacterium]
MEKRQYQRLSKSIQIKYHSHDNIEGLPHSSFTRDISAGGFMMRTNERLELGEEIDMKFYIGTEEFIPAKVKVVRADEVVPNKLYDIGLQLIDISQSDLQMLNDYMDSNLEK